MITGKDIYEVLSAVVPLYVAMVLAYGSVRWWKIFTPDQCSGIKRFVAVFAIPVLTFHFIFSNSFYAMNLRFIAADTLQKLVILVALFLWQYLSKHGDLGWTITLFSLSTLSNTHVVGIPLLKTMYGDFLGSLMIQIVVMQCLVWCTSLLFLFEYRGRRRCSPSKSRRSSPLSSPPFESTPMSRCLVVRSLSRLKRRSDRTGRSKRLSRGGLRMALVLLLRWN